MWLEHFGEAIFAYVSHGFYCFGIFCVERGILPVFLAVSHLCFFVIDMLAVCCYWYLAAVSGLCAVAFPLPGGLVHVLDQLL